jgi:hypothetical protein
VKALIGAGADLNLKNKVSGDIRVELATFAGAPFGAEKLFIVVFYNMLPRCAVKLLCSLSDVVSAIIFFRSSPTIHWCALTFSFSIAWLDGAQNGMRLGPHSRSAVAD